jgi:hypothetical protein
MSTSCNKKQSGSLSLTVARGQDFSDEGTRDEVLSLAPGEDSPPARLLVVDDEWLVALSVADVLADQGFAVIGPRGHPG